MRKNTQNVFNAWFDGRSERKQQSIWTDGATIYSYNTPILYTNETGALVFNIAKYSRTTSNHQNSIRVMCNNKHVEYIHTN